MGEECDHWLVQRSIKDRYWACVDCEQEFRPVDPAHGTVNDVGNLFPTTQRMLLSQSRRHVE